MNIQFLKDLLVDLADVNSSLKECKRDTERGMSDALSGDGHWSKAKVIEELGSTASDACFEIDNASDMIIAIMDILESEVDQIEFDDVVQNALKKT
jgi:hypothetical protein